VRFAPAAAALALLCVAQPAFAQTIAVEVDATAGITTTNEVRAAALQGRAFGEIAAGFRYFLEGSWGRRYWAGKPPNTTDAFGSAYPYANEFKPIENYIERAFRHEKGLAIVKAGRYRTPFGLSARGEHAYNGLLRAPLIRYDGYFGLSNNYLEHGASLLVGTPALQVQASLGRPADVGSVRRRRGLDTVARAQVFRGPLMAGVSFSRTLPYQPRTFALGHAIFTGVDARWMQHGVQVRGEWITGRPFDGTSTRGGYVDLSVHRQQLGPLTLVARAEYLDYDAAVQFAASGSRYAAGGHLRLPYGFTLQSSVVRQTGKLITGKGTALDTAITYSVRWR
jgi:hypothetical protein